MVPIKSTAQEQDVIIKRGAEAPFTGVLVPEDNYRYYQTRELEADSLSKLVAQPNVIIEPENHWGLFTMFLAGAVVGVVGKSLIDKK